MRVLVVESTSEWRWVEVNEWRRVALIHSISFTGRLHPSVQGTDDLRRLSGLFRYHVRTHWNGVHQNRRESKGQCQDCLFGGCDLYSKWWVQRVRRIVFIRDARLKNFFSSLCRLPQASARSRRAPSTPTRSQQSFSTRCLWHRSKSSVNVQHPCSMKTGKLDDEFSADMSWAPPSTSAGAELSYASSGAASCASP